MRFGKLLELDTSTQRQLFPRGSWAKPRHAACFARCTVVLVVLHSPAAARTHVRGTTTTRMPGGWDQVRVRKSNWERRSGYWWQAGRRAGRRAERTDMSTVRPTPRNATSRGRPEPGPEPGSSLTEGRWKGANPAAGGGDNKQWTGMKKKCSKNLTT